jgi:hypothetical protein
MISCCGVGIIQTTRSSQGKNHPEESRPTIAVSFLDKRQIFFLDVLVPPTLFYAQVPQPVL